MNKLIITFLVIFVTGCAESHDSAPAEIPTVPDVIIDATLIDTWWILKAYKNTTGETMTVTGDSEYSITFREFYSSKNAFGRIGCHQFWSDYSITDTIITIDISIFTTNNCAPSEIELSLFEQFYLNSIMSIANYNIVGNELTFQASDSTELIYEPLQ